MCPTNFTGPVGEPASQRFKFDGAGGVYAKSQFLGKTNFLKNVSFFRNPFKILDYWLNS